MTLHNEAVWIENEQLSFESSGADSGRLGNEGENTVLVKAIDLVQHLQQYEHIDFIKIDIEGAEYDLLHHIEPELKRVQSLFVECHTFVNQTQEIGQLLEILKNSGFRYLIHNETNRRSPITNRKEFNGMDLQLNVFAYRE